MDIEKDFDIKYLRLKSSFYETGWDREDRLILNLISMIRIEEDPEKKKEYQNMLQLNVQQINRGKI